jgi:ABC-type transporter Mla maintaining outer membrane lipid asymmetry permease subunit MlaE
VGNVLNSKRQAVLIGLIIAVNAVMYFFDEKQSSSVGVISSTVKTNIVVLLAVLCLYWIWSRLDRGKETPP